MTKLEYRVCPETVEKVKRKLGVNKVTKTDCQNYFMNEAQKIIPGDRRRYDKLGTRLTDLVLVRSDETKILIKEMYVEKGINGQENNYDKFEIVSGNEGNYKKYEIYTKRDNEYNLDLIKLQDSQQQDYLDFVADIFLAQERLDRYQKEADRKYVYMGGIRKDRNKYQKEIDENLNEVYENIDSARTRAYKIRKINVPEPTKEEITNEIISKLKGLSEEQLKAVLKQIEFMKKSTYERFS